ncbi:hypothetical protein [Micromonospora sp. WMMD1219]|uniref:hypothetical protein n=1 Tax=Micromonospora sp. WMMD1219 TaxID=3404115 RepID=UPI003BF5DF04
MEPSQFDLGAVFRWAHDDRPMRILMHDDEVVMYDAWWPHLEAWGMTDLKDLRRGRVDYYAATLSALSKRATYVRTEPLTAGESGIHRPDLPLSAGCCADVDWPKQAPGTVRLLAETAGFADCLNKDGDTSVSASELYLYPFSSRGGQKRAVRIEAEDLTAFTLDELLWRAADAQAPFVGDKLPVRGIGLYRSGLQRGIPAYYLWGSASRLHSTP